MVVVYTKETVETSIKDPLRQGQSGIPFLVEVTWNFLHQFHKKENYYCDDYIEEDKKYSHTMPQGETIIMSKKSGASGGFSDQIGNKINHV